MDDLVAILVPIFICCILPVSIVLIVYRSSAYSTKKRAEVLMKAIECNPELDVESLAKSMTKASKTPEQILGHRLLCGTIYSLLGLFSIVGCIILKAMYSYEVLTIILILAACIFLPVGMGYIITWTLTRKDKSLQKSAE